MGTRQVSPPLRLSRLRLISLVSTTMHVHRVPRFTLIFNLFMFIAAVKVEDDFMDVTCHLLNSMRSIPVLEPNL